MQTFLLLFVSSLINFGDPQIIAEDSALHTLKFIHVIPSQINATTWKEGSGELTKLGTLQQYQFGQFLRKRYDGFLSKTYSPFEMYIRSSDYNRTLMSAQAISAGLYPPSDDEIFVPGIMWRPIPVHTKSKETDYIVFDFDNNCEVTKNEFAKIYSSEEIKKYEIENKDFLTYIAEKAGYPEVPISLKNIWYLYDPLLAQFLHRDEHDLPDWVNETVFDRISDLYQIFATHQVHTDTMKRVMMGPLFMEILDRMKSVENGTYDSRQKFVEYAGHEITVGGILEMFGISPLKYPAYSTFVILELHNDSSNFFVKLFYKNETKGTKLWEYTIPNCEPICTLRLLEDSRRSSIPVNWEKECGNAPKFSIGANLVALIIMTAISIGSILYILYLHQQIRLSKRSMSSQSFGI